MPVRGQVMYNCFDGELEQVKFLEEGLAHPSCGETTYLMQRLDGEKFRCSKDMYVESEEEARQKHLKRCQEYLPKCKMNVEKAKTDLLLLEHEILRTQARLDDIRDRKARQEAYKKSKVS